MQLTAERVAKIFFDCLFNKGEDTATAVWTEGIAIRKMGFHPGRLESHRQEISELLLELPETFLDGMSFLMACNDKHGNQWGEHRNMEQLFCLGMAIGQVECPMPRMNWPCLPGGMPYYIVKPLTESPTNGEETQVQAEATEQRAS